MIGVLHLTLLLDEVLLLVGSLVVLVRPGGASWLSQGAWVLQSLLVVQVAVGLTWLSRGAHLARPGLFASYLVASVTLLPTAGALTRRDDVRTTAGRLAAGAVLALVVQVRIASVWADRVG